ncbi:MAG: efflux RND transporter periplasmic adaptor subunit [Candidatus Omnitrophica bacterium]|nr:efflux RND transporter periplasmic adaptor subunit [Candidatus Omnitrophota bacterium]MCA9433782.1 efflux RND transporter periplasmic adaptor subunit [Candidatus Omnitrophota bacterium]MCA9435800.1 efflux RND transporter periplasmic adaptor subunit [Candidatus Omnitrophota bacterium]
MNHLSRTQRSLAYLALTIFFLIFLAIFVSQTMGKKSYPIMSDTANASSNDETGEPASSSNDGWEMEIAEEDHAGHDHEEESGHEDHEGHSHGEEAGHDEHEEHEPGVVHLDANSIRNFGIATETINSGGLVHTLDLYGWIRPRPEKVFTVRAPFKAILAEVHQLPGDRAAAGDPLVTLVIPDMLDWKTTILSSQNEIERIKETRDLLKAEGQARIVELIGNYLENRAEVQKLESETKILEQAGANSISVREMEVKKGELNVARSSLAASNSILHAYGVDPTKLKEDSNDPEYDRVAGEALPPDIRTKLKQLDFELKASQLASSAAAAKLRMLDIEGDCIESLTSGDAEALDDRLVIRAPYPGIVTRITHVPRTSVAADEEILRMIDYRQVYVEIEVPEVDVAKVLRRDSDEIHIRAESLGGEVLRGKVAYFDTEVLAEERMAHLVVEIENVEGMILRDGMVVMAGVPLREEEEVLAVPRNSVIDDGMEKVVFVQEASGDFRRIPVLTGTTTLTEVEIKEGLEPGAEVAVSGVRPLLLALQKQEGRSQAGGHGHAH